MDRATGSAQSEGGGVEDTEEGSIASGGSGERWDGRRGGDGKRRKEEREGGKEGGREGGGREAGRQGGERVEGGR